MYVKKVDTLCVSCALICNRSNPLFFTPFLYVLHYFTMNAWFPKFKNIKIFLYIALRIRFYNVAVKKAKKLCLYFSRRDRYQLSQENIVGVNNQSSIYLPILIRSTQRSRVRLEQLRFHQCLLIKTNPTPTLANT